MSGILHAWPAGLLVALWTTVSATAGWLLQAGWRWLRSTSEWERDENRQLRKALDRLRRRENAYATGFELVLIVIPPELSPQQRIAVERARQLFETTILHSEGN